MINKISMMADFSTVQGTSLLSITAHEASDDILQTVCLSVSPFSRAHTADQVEEEVKRVAFDFGIPSEKVFAKVTDHTQPQT
jgi:hypothetical protein